RRSLVVELDCVLAVVVLVGRRRHRMRRDLGRAPTPWWGRRRRRRRRWSRLRWGHGLPTGRLGLNAALRRLHLGHAHSLSRRRDARLLDSSRRRRSGRPSRIVLALPVLLAVARERGWLLTVEGPPARPAPIPASVDVIDVDAL